MLFAKRCPCAVYTLLPRKRGAMRVKRARKVRKYLRFYRTCHGFRAPYKVRLGADLCHLVVSQANARNLAAAAFGREGGTMRNRGSVAEAWLVKI